MSIILIDGYIYLKARGEKTRIENEIELAERKSEQETKDIEDQINSLKDSSILDTVSWRTYNNNQYGFSLEYPSFFQEFQPGVMTDGNEFEIMFITDDYISLPFMIFISESGQNETLNDFLDPANADKILSREDISFLGYPAKKFLMGREPDDGFLSVLFFDRDGKQYMITGEDNHFFEAILKSFQFRD